MIKVISWGFSHDSNVIWTAALVASLVLLLLWIGFCAFIAVTVNSASVGIALFGAPAAFLLFDRYKKEHADK